MNAVGRNLLERANLTVPADFDGAAMMAEIDSAFERQALIEAAETPPARQADLNIVSRLVKQAAAAEKTLAAAMDRPATRLRLANELELQLPAFLAGYRSLETAQEYVKAIMRTASVVATATERMVAMEEDSHEGKPPLNGWLIAERLPAIFERYCGGRRAFTPVSDTKPHPSACIRFIQEAQREMNEDPMTDIAIVGAEKRWRAHE